MGTLGFGIVGCGKIAEFHARAIDAVDGAELVAVFDKAPGAARRLNDNWGCHDYSDIEEFLAHDGLDVVTIATPSGAHLEPAVAAANAGKHVICEKPLEITLERVDAMIRACAENDVLLSAILPLRYGDAVLAFREAVQQQRLGQVILADAYIKIYRSQAYYDSGSWRGTWELDGGGALMNQGIHYVDLLLHLNGDVEEVTAFAGVRGHERIEVEDVAAATLRFRNGAFGVIEGSTACFSTVGLPQKIQLCGTQGTVFLEGDKLSRWEFAEELDGDEKTRQRFAPQDRTGIGSKDPMAISFRGHQRCFEDMVRAIRHGGQPETDGAEGRRAVELILAIYQSAWESGERIRLPLTQPPEYRSFADQGDGLSVSRGEHLVEPQNQQS